MAEVKRTKLDWARDVARAYRWALLRIDPAGCAELDAQARDAGQLWIAPAHIPADAAEAAITAILTPAEIARIAGIPAGTIYSWVSRGLLTPAEGSPGKYLVRDVLSIEARRKVRRLDSA